jgi:small subunit ribosomal protein S1
MVDKGATIHFNEDIIAFVPSRHLEKEDGSKLGKGDEAVFKIIEFNKEFKRVVASHTVLFKEQEIKNLKRATKNLAAANSEKATLGDLDALASLKEQMDNDK